MNMRRATVFLAINCGTTVLAQVVNVECPNQCSGHGLCFPNTALSIFQCTCTDGYFGADCSKQACPSDVAWVDVASADDVAHAVAECSNAGICDHNTGTCSCLSGFEGIACERTRCPHNDNGEICSYHGTCKSISEMGELVNDVSAFRRVTYTEMWDADKVFGCACELGWTGYDCSVRQCAFGDDPVTTGQVDEIQEITCTCDGTCTGGIMFSFRDEVTSFLEFDSSDTDVEAALESLSTLRDVTVDLTGNLCADGTNPLTITFVGNSGDVPPIRVVYSTLESDAGDPTTEVVELTKGTKEYAECNNRGKCNRDSGICECSSGYKSSNGAGQEGISGDCGFLNTTDIQCPTVKLKTQVGTGDGVVDGYGFDDLPCGRFGTCESDFTCTCFDGFTGFDCTQRTCPRGLAWFDEPLEVDTAHLEAECSNRGICDRKTGSCVCEAGFEGASCARLSCPSSAAGDACHGGGSCGTMRIQALSHKDDEGNLEPLTYGTILNNPSTWDADKIQGCICDDGFFGYDCSLRSCARGSPPGPASSAATEIQTITCESSDEPADTSIEITFQDRTTATLSGASTASEVASALEAIGTGGVDVVIDNTGVLCDAGDNVTIEFLDKVGTVGVLTVASSTSSVNVTIDETQKSSRLDLECSDLGTCDYVSGLCECFANYASSDGAGGRGSIGDCGYFNVNN